MTTPVTPKRSHERILRLCRTGGGAREMRAALLEQLRGVIGFDGHVFVLTDPRTCVGCDPHADVPLLDQLPRLIRLKYTTTVNRWTSLGEPPVGLLSEATCGRPERSRMWREMLEPAGIVDVASVVFRDRYGCWGFLDLWRARPAAAFSPADVTFLAGIAPAVTAALRHSQAATFAGPAVEAGHLTPLVLLLTPDLVIRAQTPRTHDYLRELLPPPPERSPIPAAAYNVAAQLIAVEEGVDDHPPFASVHLAHGRWLTLRAARMGGSPSGRGADIAVTIEHASPRERLEIFGRAFGLSARERQLVHVLAGGVDTRDAAARLYMSPHTVQDHLKSIFDKTATRSRRQLLAKAIG